MDSNISLTDAVLAFHFITCGTDTSERPLQILTGARRTRAGQGNTLIRIFKEKQEKKMTYRWHHCCQMIVTWIQLKPSDLPGYYGEICPQGFLTPWVLLIWQEVNFPLSTLIETQIALSSVPIKTLHAIPNLWFILFYQNFPRNLSWPMYSDDQMKCKMSPKVGCAEGGGSHIIILQNKTTQRLHFIVCCLDTYLYSSCHLE